MKKNLSVFLFCICFSLFFLITAKENVPSGKKSAAAEIESLELNPDNQSGRDSLNRIRLDYRSETKETAKFTPEQKIKLKGLYLGQTSPDLDPKVFAPGIVSTTGRFRKRPHSVRAFPAMNRTSPRTENICSMVPAETSIG